MMSIIKRWVILSLVKLMVFKICRLLSGMHSKLFKLVRSLAQQETAKR